MGEDGDGGGGGGGGGLEGGWGLEGEEEGGRWWGRRGRGRVEGGGWCWVGRWDKG